MRLLSWNYQRLGNPWIGRSLLKFVKDQVPDVCFLMETRLDEDGFNDLYRDLPFKNKLFVKKPNAGGGLALLWKQDIQLDLINYSEHHILVKVREDDGFEWFLTGFYGWLESDQKSKSWVLLSHLAMFAKGPWCCIGDFNSILYAAENRVHVHCRLGKWRNLGVLWRRMAWLT